MERSSSLLRSELSLKSHWVLVLGILYIFCTYKSQRLLVFRCVNICVEKDPNSGRRSITIVVPSLGGHETSGMAAVPDTSPELMSALAVSFALLS